MRMDYQIMLTSEIHHDVSANAVTGSSP